MISAFFVISSIIFFQNQWDPAATEQQRHTMMMGPRSQEAEWFSKAMDASAMLLLDLPARLRYMMDLPEPEPMSIEAHAIEVGGIPSFRNGLIPQYRDRTCYYCHIFLHGPDPGGIDYGGNTEAEPTVGSVCGSANVKDCKYPGLGHDNIYIMICTEGGKKAGTCPDPSSTDKVLSCVNSPLIGTQDPECRQCVPWGGPCERNQDCCVGLAEDIPAWPLPLGISPQCHEGKCIACLHDLDPCEGVGIPSCNSLTNAHTTTSCRKFTGIGTGGKKKGHRHNSLMGMVIFKALNPDPCSQEAFYARLGNGTGAHKPLESSGLSYCYLQGQFFLKDTRYRNTYFCNCPKDKFTGYSCQKVQKYVGQDIGPKSNTVKDDGFRCLSCGLAGHRCGKNKLRCCTNHFCNKKGICAQAKCTLEGNQFNHERKKTACCNGNHRNIKDKRCTNNVCVEKGGECGSGEECCGTSITCISKTVLGQGYCKDCIPDGGNCRGMYDCCGVTPYWQWLAGGGNYKTFSTCKNAKCQRCSKTGGPCGEYGPDCCGSTGGCGTNGKCE